MEAARVGHATPVPGVATEAGRPERQRGTLSVLLELSKVRITLASTFTTAVGWFLGPQGGLRVDLVYVLAGTFVLACGSAALNQVQDAGIDAKMERTRGRPIPSGRIERSVAALVSILLLLVGSALLSSVSQNPNETLAIGLVTALWYNVVYTYLKRVTAFAVVPGALVGALPPLMGYVAAGGNITDPYIGLVATFFFIWQIPHFWLLVLMFGEEYGDAGLPSLTRVLGRGQIERMTFVWIAATAAAGLVLAARAPVEVEAPWKLMVAAASVWLVYVSSGRRPVRRRFMQVNAYALFVMLAVTVGFVA